MARTKRLSVNKEILRILRERELKAINGGGEQPPADDNTERCSDELP